MRVERVGWHWLTAVWLLNKYTAVAAGSKSGYAFDVAETKKRELS